MTACRPRHTLDGMTRMAEGDSALLRCGLLPGSPEASMMNQNPIVTYRSGQRKRTVTTVDWPSSPYLHPQSAEFR